MKILAGAPISGGLAEGHAFIIKPCSIPDTMEVEIGMTEVANNVERLHCALAEAAVELNSLEHDVMTELGTVEQQVLSAHLAMITDKVFISKIENRIKENRYNVERAIQTEVSDMVRMLASVENEYISERSADVQDIGARILRNLIPNKSEIKQEFPTRSILITRQLLPSDILHLNKENIVAIITETGGLNDHTAIITRAMGIPYVTGVPDICSLADNGELIEINGHSGEIILSPDEIHRNSFSISLEKQQELLHDGSDIITGPCRTKDGRVISLFGNISDPTEADDVVNHNLCGVNLLRTEFLFFDVSSPPSEKEQREVYNETLQRLRGLPLTIRILDLGGDKWPLFASFGSSDNPNLGLRGLRYLLSEKMLLITQIRAILTTDFTDNLRIMFPMVIDGSDFKAARDIVVQEAQNLGLERIPAIGAMIETPSAIFQIDSIMREADFVSIGSNDLTQFILAADRNSLEMLDDYSVLHPAVLKAVKEVIVNGKKHRCSVSICGEAAGNPLVAGLLIGLGLKILSMSPIRALAVRKQLQYISLIKMESVAKLALRAESAQEVRDLLHRSFPGGKC